MGTVNILLGPCDGLASLSEGIGILPGMHAVNILLGPCDGLASLSEGIGILPGMLHATDQTGISSGCLGLYLTFVRKGVICVEG